MKEKFLLVAVLLAFALNANAVTYYTKPTHLNIYEIENDECLCLSEECMQEDNASFLTEKDPFKFFNKAIFDFNMFMDTILLEPIVNIYDRAAPKPLQKHISFFVKNMSLPITFANQLLQGKLNNASNTFWRFTINIVYGFGLTDYASDFGLNYRKEDFGQTLAVWGVPDGSYIVLPLFGSSTLRDTAGKLVDLYIDPVNAKLASPERKLINTTRLINNRHEKEDILQQIKYYSLDPYVKMRSLYLQNRNKLIRSN